MHFHFTDFNHCDIGKRSIEDLILIVSKQAEALGHTTSFWNEQNWFDYSSNSINVVLESFADNPNTIKQISAAHKHGAKFLYIATEEPGTVGFNNTGDQGMIDRQNAFAEAAKYCEGVLHLVPGQAVTDWYSQFAPSVYAELGWAPSLMRPRETTPEYTFGFFGQMSARRERILEQFAPDILVCPGILLHQEQRDAEMRRCKVILQIRRFDEMGLISSSRCNTALSIGRPVIAEPHPIPTWWENVVQFSNSKESFYDEAQLLAANWLEEYKRQLVRFATILTPEVCLGAPLKKLGLVCV